MVALNVTEEQFRRQELGYNMYPLGEINVEVEDASSSSRRAFVCRQEGKKVAFERTLLNEYHIGRMLTERQCKRRGRGAQKVNLVSIKSSPAWIIFFRGPGSCTFKGTEIGKNLATRVTRTKENQC